MMQKAVIGHNAEYYFMTPVVIAVCSDQPVLLL